MSYSHSTVPAKRPRAICRYVEIIGDPEHRDSSLENGGQGRTEFQPVESVVWNSDGCQVDANGSDRHGSEHGSADVVGDLAGIKFLAVATAVQVFARGPLGFDRHYPLVLTHHEVHAAIPSVFDASNLHPVVLSEETRHSIDNVTLVKHEGTV